MKKLLGVLQKILSDILAFCVLIFFTILVIKPMRANQGMWRIFDDVHVIRTIEMRNELLAGQFPVRFVQNFGNAGGYPLFNYYSPLTYYLSATLVFLGTNPLNSVKLLFQLAYFVFAGGMYFFLSRGLKITRFQALVLSVVSLYSAYFNFDAYIRGSLAELLAFSLIPIFLLGFEKMSRKVTRRWVVFSSFILTAIFLFHAITGIIISLTATILFVSRKIVRSELTLTSLLPLLALFTLTGLESAFYLVPAFFEKGYVQYGTADFVKNGYLSAAVSLQEVFGLTSFNPEITPTTLGFGLSLLLFGFLVHTLSNYMQIRKHGIKMPSDLSRRISYGVAALSVVFLVSSASNLLWAHVSILQALQFPYRFLSALTVIGLAAIALWLKVSRHVWQRGILLGVALLAAVQTSYFAQPIGYYFSDTFTADDECSTTTWQQEYLPKATSVCLEKGAEPFVRGDESVKITSYAFAHDQISFETDGNPGVVQISKYYLPMWSARTQEGEELALYPSGESGLITIDVTPDTKSVVVSLEKTWIQKTTEFVSLIAVVILALYMLYESYRLISRRIVTGLKSSKK